jgi:hypothetical protein
LNPIPKYDPVRFFYVSKEFLKSATVFHVQNTSE